MVENTARKWLQHFTRGYQPGKGYQPSKPNNGQAVIRPPIGPQGGTGQSPPVNNPPTSSHTKD